MKKILFCCPYRIDKTLGGAKVYIEAAESLKNKNWDVTIISPDDLGKGQLSNLPDLEKMNRYSYALRDYLIKVSQEYDVIEYEHLFLPFDRSLFSPKTLMVARSILLAHQFKTFEMPIFKTIKSFISSKIFYFKRKNELNLKIQNAELTFKNADLITVPNSSDKQLLIDYGHSAEKIILAPYGLFSERFSELSQESTKSDIKTPEIAFIGTFDLRKGAREFPEIITTISKKIPNIKFKLIGTSAMFPTKESILHYLPVETHPFVEIIPKFKPEELKIHIVSSTLGIFPSHMESFGFGVLEMMTAGLPVVAYDVPGPNELLPQSLLVPRNNFQDMCSKLVKLIQDQNYYQEMRTACLERSKRFNWNEIGRNVSMLYLNEIQANNKRNV